MDAERITAVFRARLVKANTSGVANVLLMTVNDFNNALRAANDDVADALGHGSQSKLEPPEPPKTVLPDMSDAEMGKTYWFLGEDGTKVEYRRDNAFDDLLWIVRGGSGPCSNWSPARYFVSHYPHLGRLREAIPGGWA